MLMKLPSQSLHHSSSLPSLPNRPSKSSEQHHASPTLTCQAHALPATHILIRRHSFAGERSDTIFSHLSAASAFRARVPREVSLS